ncbi:hypothetical protein DPMN_037919 [Dreissena polymorpha]|uniref:Uncharacterized protein n=1 Tax=Dreissena polymorpha TaxID=45954 RepID=A0A9D4MDE7_DREPO|nr:hypothetical protein DPMN_037919 [Dreissena polymorpha]
MNSDRLKEVNSFKYFGATLSKDVGRVTQSQNAWCRHFFTSVPKTDPHLLHGAQDHRVRLKRDSNSG